MHIHSVHILYRASSDDDIGVVPTPMHGGTNSGSSTPSRKCCRNVHAPTQSTPIKRMKGKGLSTYNCTEVDFFH